MQYTTDHAQTLISARRYQLSRNTVLATCLF